MTKMPQLIERSVRPAWMPRRARLRTVDLMTALLVASGLATIGAATLAAYRHGTPPAAPSLEVADSLAVLRQTFGYDGVALELDRLRHGTDAQATQNLMRSLRAARAAIGLLRKELADSDAEAGRALDQLESANRRLETVLHAGQDGLPASIVDLPVLEPLFVLDRSTEALEEAVFRQDGSRVEHMLWLTAAAAALLATSGLLLAGWTRLTVLTPLHRLAADLAQDSRSVVEQFRHRRDEFGTLARLIPDRASPGQPVAAEERELRTMLQDHAGMLERTRDLLEELARQRTNEPEPIPVASASATPLVIHGQDIPAAEDGRANDTNEPEPPVPATPLVLTATMPWPPMEKPAAVTNEPKPARTEMLHSIVEMVAKEQIRRHRGEPAGQTALAASNQDDQLMATLVDRVLARLDQVTERVNLKQAPSETRRAS
ncbi:MAG TPA: hypothetical protein VHL31_15795 [Geminicoccus sp.]|jgi:hypothetical protein|uniref:hypothetical protein n=1 Tax=Geminicoccus sp. TaxID=2024832 RepID=UPI002E304290|nr:hypothetical protein [Geminicoccus sp.]HEX2527746.1 hypothetical protein [Geminicoccus sp.]